MALLIIIAIIIFIVVIYNMDKNDMLKRQVDFYGGMVNKYQTLVNKICEFENAKIIKVTRSEIHITANFKEYPMYFQIIETFDAVAIKWTASFGIYGKHKNNWKFSPSFPQEKMVISINEFIHWKMDQILGNNMDELEPFNVSNISDNKHLTSQNIIDVCKEAAELFPMNYVEEFETDKNIDPNNECEEYDYDNNDVSCRKFTAFMFCCSIANSKRIIHGKLSPYDFKDPFFVSFIELILNEARNINNIHMHEALAGGFDGDGFYVEETPEYLAMEYMYKAAHLIIYAAEPEVTLQLRNLSYNFFVVPGSLNYRDDFERHILNDTKKNQELNNSIGKASRMILPKIL